VTEDPLLLGKSPLWSSAEIINRLVRRYKLEDIASESNAMLIPRVIQPITNIDRLLETSGVERRAAFDPGGTGFFTIVEVPEGKRWEIIGFRGARVTGATITFNAFAMTPAGGTQFIALTFTASADFSYIFPQSLPLEEGGIPQLSVNAYTTGTCLMDILVREEDAF